MMVVSNIKSAGFKHLQKMCHAKIAGVSGCSSPLLSTTWHNNVS